MVRTAEKRKRKRVVRGLAGGNATLFFCKGLKRIKKVNNKSAAKD
jgi:hypothetical protein